MEKYDIINGLAREFGFRRYLEICTPTTGRKYQFIDTALFDVSDRLMYRCSDDFTDGADITFRDPADTSLALMRHLDATLAADVRYDVILVDPYHGYRESMLDLCAAMCLLQPNGVLVVHDCNPTDAETVQPHFREGDWCGVTYQAFIDFVLGVGCAGYCTVDVDYGCGVVFNVNARVPAAWRDARPSERLILDWTACADDDVRRFAFFEQHRATLLNLVTAERFQAIHPFTGARMQPPDSDVITGSGEPHVIADGKRIEASYADSHTWQFIIPAGVRSLRLRSRSARPDKIGESADSRLLGVCLTSLTVRLGDEEITVPIDHPWLQQGLHGVERMDGSMWRWADGDTPLPMALLGHGQAAVVLTIRGHLLPRPPAG